VLIFLDLVQGGTNRALGGVMGLMAGHLWWFLATYLPTQAPVHLRRANPLGMPPWFRRQFATRSNVTGSSGASTGRATAVGGVQVTAPRDDNAAAQVRHRWGSGNKLGGTGL
jgi:Derlin-2/3